MKKETLNRILAETEIGYDLVAEKFSETRKHFWRGLEFIKDYAKDGDKILDLGCGNGRLMELFADKKIDYTGMDVSQKLIDLAKKSHPEKNIKFAKINSSQDSLPLGDDFFNSVYSIAVFHHFSKEHAGKMAQELYRVIKPGGYAMVTVWNLWQKKYFKNILRNWLDKLMGKSELDWKDCYITFQNNQGEVFQRYHHAYTKKELKRLFTGAGFMAEKCEIIDGRNIIFIGKKI